MRYLKYDIFSILKLSFNQLILLHLFISLIALISKFFLIFWVFYASMSFFLNFQHNREVNNILLLSYIVSLEVACRMLKTSPWVPYELGKYLLILYPILRSKKIIKSINMATPLLPGISIALFNGIWILHLVHDIFAWFSVVFFGKFISNFKFTKGDLIKLLLLILSGCFCALCIAFFKSPDLADIEFSYDANRQTSGGYASNQVSTIFGLGIAICAFFFFIDSKVIGGHILILLFTLFLFRGILTFSRGGIIVGLSLLILFFFLKIFYQGIKMKHLLVVVASSVVLVLSVQIIDRISDGMLLNRLQGKTIGTEIGIKEANLNTLTSGRLNIFEEDLSIFRANPIFGVGVHQSAQLRALNNVDGVAIASHVELSRLLAEHGLLGFIFFMSLLKAFWQSYNFHQLYFQRSFILLALVIGLGTTFHSATRTFVTPLFMSFVFVRINRR